MTDKPEAPDSPQEPGSLLFINTTAHNVITGGNPSELDVMVEALQ